jgi:hypothetical protein
VSGSPEEIPRDTRAGQNSGPGWHLIDPFYLSGRLCYIFLAERPIWGDFQSFMKKNASFEVFACFAQVT